MCALIAALQLVCASGSLLYSYWAFSSLLYIRRVRFDGCFIVAVCELLAALQLLVVYLAALHTAAVCTLTAALRLQLLGVWLAALQLLG